MACSTGEQASDTKTNWLKTCDTHAECGEEFACICGLCTSACSADAECEGARCGTTIATAAQCGEAATGPSSERICLPDSDEACTEAPLVLNAPLGAAVPASCDAVGALLCEDFEDTLPAEYSTWSSGSESLLQDCDVHAGSGALTYRGAGAAWAQTRMRLAAPAASGALHVRFYMKLDAASILPSQLILLELWDLEEGDVPERITLYLDQSEALSAFVGASMQTLTEATPAAFGRGAWHCVELGVELSDTAGSLTVLVDGATVVSGSGFDSLPAGPISVAVLESLSNGTAADTNVALYLDDLVVADGPIGCE